ncbi:hypothetical protein NC652_038454 [Populus alba x Populus x berolinensis]|nr:hypothetical protein NC652_038454 [Populus alba x Populus x berolinensis]
MQDKDQGTSCFIISTILSPLSSFEQYFSSNSVRVEEDEEKKKKSDYTKSLRKSLFLAQGRYGKRHAWQILGKTMKYSFEQENTSNLCSTRIQNPKNTNIKDVI